MGSRYVGVVCMATSKGDLAFRLDLEGVSVVNMVLAFWLTAASAFGRIVIHIGSRVELILFWGLLLVE